MNVTKFICSRCHKTLKGSAVCMDCDNKEAAEKEPAFKDLANSIADIIRWYRKSMKVTLKKAGLSVEDSALNPEVRSFLREPANKKQKKHKKSHRK